MDWLELKKKVKKFDSNIYINDECFAIHITDAVTIWCWSDKEIRLISDNCGNCVRIKIKKMNTYDDV